MEKIKKKYIVDENNNRVAVEIDLKTFYKIEEIMENHGLYKLMRENDSDEKLSIKEAKAFYSKLPKEN